MGRRTGVLGLLLVTLVGCVGPQTRLQMGDDAETKRDLSLKTVGDVTEVANVGPVQVSGVGLITGLQGTGGSPKGLYRSLLEQELRKRRVENVSAVLDSTDNATVLVTTMIPAGARRGDRVDVEITLPPGSKVTSLAGGFLQDCAMRNHDTTKNLSPDFDGNNRLLQGHVLARAKGPLLAGFGADGEPAELKRALVWQGCVSLIDRPFFFVLRKDDKSARVANAVAERLNFMFQEDPQKAQRLTQQQKNLLLLGNVTEQINQKLDPNTLATGSAAKAVGKELINVRVPYGYRFNPERYLLVARQVPLEEDAETMARYRRRLQKMIADPAEALRAAVRLEALGKEAVPTLKQGLSHDNALVRFACAESLAYLGSTAGADELARLAGRHPMLTNYCLIALANLDEPVCRTKLAEMLGSSDVELRCGAFFALRLLDERDPRLGGELLNEAFWLHKVASQSDRLVNFAISKRAEIVLFGDAIALTRPVRTLVGQEFTVTMEPGDDRCTLSRISAHGGKRSKQTSPKLEDVVRGMADLGAEYADVVDLLRKLDERQVLNSAVKINALPPEVSVQTLDEMARTGTFFQHQGPAIEEERRLLQEFPTSAKVHDVPAN